MSIDKPTMAKLKKFADAFKTAHVRKGQTFYFRVGFVNGVGSIIQPSAFTR